LLKAFGVRLGSIGRAGIARAVHQAAARVPMTSGLVQATADALCRRFMAIPGVGPVTALSFSSAIEDPTRFRRSRDVAAYFGLTAKRWQSGTSIDVKGRISKVGDGDVRHALYEPASALLTRFKGVDRIKGWGLKFAKGKSYPKARVAVARKLAVVMHAMWRDGTSYVGDPAVTEQMHGAWFAAKVQRLSDARS
jgi:transposase